MPNGKKSPLIAIVDNGQLKNPVSFSPVAENDKLKVGSLKLIPKRQYSAKFPVQLIRYLYRLIVLCLAA